MRRLALLVLMPAFAAAAEEEPAWATGSFAAGTWANGTWNDAETALVPNVVGEADSTAAEIILVADGFVLGDVRVSCSVVTADEIIRQNPLAGATAELGSEVDVTASSGEQCRGSLEMGPNMGIGIGE